MKKFLLLALFLSLATSSIARPFVDVTRAMMSVIPESEEAIRIDLLQLIQIESLFKNNFPPNWENNYSPELIKHIINMFYKAPEQRVKILWHDLISCFNKYYPDFGNLNPWQQTAAEILIGTLAYEDFL